MIELLEKKEEKKRHSVSGLKILDYPGQSFDEKNIEDELSSHEKPGYKICSHVNKFIKAGTGFVPSVKTKLEPGDYFSAFYVRCGIRRNKYMVSPGLYAVGNPDKTSEVLVTANFKLTFDSLRKELDGLDLWILVLDTKGVNVWCAAAKGTFSTEELCQKIKDTRLEEVVNHKRLILPQLGAVGVSGFDVKKNSGFGVIFGPVRACDLPGFLKQGKKADEKMREVTFTMYERFVLTPVEFQVALKPVLIAAVILFLISGAGPEIFSFKRAFERGIVSVSAMIIGIFSGAFITPVFLPYIPGRAFALKGIISGVFCGFAFIYMHDYINNISGFAALFLLIVFVSSVFAMNFTGSTPYTSPSGVEREMKFFIPVQAVGLVLFAILWIYSAF